MSKIKGPVLEGALFASLLATAIFFLHIPGSLADQIALILFTFLVFPILLVTLLHQTLEGWFFFAAANLVCLFFALQQRDLRLTSPLLVFGPAFFVSFLARRNMLSRDRELEVKKERLEEERNLLEVSIQKETFRSTLLDRQLQRSFSLNQLVQFLNEILSLNELTQWWVRQVRVLFQPCEGVFLFLIEEAAQESTLVASEVAEEPFKMKSKRGDLFTHWVLKNSRPLLIQDTHHDFRFDPIQARERGIRSLMVVPLYSSNRIAGLFRLESIRENAYEAEDLRFLSILADLASISLEDARLYQRTEELARVDELTGLFVYRYFQERLAEEIVRAQRSQRPLSLLMVDIDHFKQYNDQYGHIAGDLVLKQVAQILKEGTGPGEFVCRYGGEEFAVILPQRVKSDAVALAETLRQTVAQADFVLRRETTKVTLSLGVATYPEDGLLQEDLLRRVDTFLYQAKHTGRDRVCFS